MATWAKGVNFKNNNNTKTIGGVGVYGTDGIANKVYLGLGTEPWNNQGLELTASTIKFKGTDISLSNHSHSTYASTSGTYSNIISGAHIIHDTRGANRPPNYYPGRTARFDFVESSQTGAGGDTWNALLTVVPWTADYSVSHRQQQIAFTGQGLKWRVSTSATAWSGWNTLYSTANKPTASDVGAAASNHTHSYVPTSASCNKNWNWSWGNSQPTHLWGSKGSAGDFYVFNPLDLEVKVAKTSDTANMLSCTSYGTNSISSGNGDNATYSTHNLAIKGWWGIGFRDNNNNCNAVLDTRGGHLTMKGTLNAKNLKVQSPSDSIIEIKDAGSVRFGYFGRTTNTGNDLKVVSEPGCLRLYSGNGPVTLHNTIRPNGNNLFYCGCSSPEGRWIQVYAMSGTINASDSRTKQNIKPILKNKNEYKKKRILMHNLFNIDTENKTATSEDYYEFMKSRFSPYAYNYIVNEKNKEVDAAKGARAIGFVADEYDLEKDIVAKEFIFKTDDGMLNYNTSNYTTVVAIALKEAIDQIEELKRDIQQLKNI